MLAVGLSISLGALLSQQKVNAKLSQQQQQGVTPQLPVFSLSDLAAFNGTDSQKPIYLAMDGFVYDVSEGKKFYEPGGSYHYLAGRDSSQELHIAGGMIIKQKYPVVGILSLD